MQVVGVRGSYPFATFLSELHICNQNPTREWRRGLRAELKLFQMIVHSLCLDFCLGENCTIVPQQPRSNQMLEIDSWKIKLLRMNPEGTTAGVKDALTDLIFSDKVANSLLVSRRLALSLKRPHTHSAVAVSPDSLSQQWEQFKCYSWRRKKRWQKHARDSGQQIRRATASKIYLLAVAKAGLRTPLLYCRICEDHWFIQLMVGFP